MIKLKTFEDINSSTDEGKLLIMALARLTSTIYTNKTPEEVIVILNRMANTMDWD